jgi:hypothetical protein
MFDAIDTDLQDDIRAFRASRRRARCTCSLGPNPDCPMDHVGAEEERGIAAQNKLSSTAWLAENVYELDELRDPLLLAFLVAEDYAEFGRRVHDAFKRKASEEANAEQRAEVSL